MTGRPGGGPSAVERRRSAVLAGYGGDHQVATLLAADPDPAVRSAALGALLRLGALDAATLRRGLEDHDATVRRRACTIAGRHWNPSPPEDATVGALVRALEDADESVAEAAAWALGELGARCRPDAVRALCAMAENHSSPMCRESAIAALGAVGAPDTLPVVLAALDDTPNIRRRAAVALAAFDDPSAEEGLRRCLDDRDWQVRQAAVELLADS